MESCVQRWQPRTNVFCNFSSPSVWIIALATKKWCQVIQSVAPVTQNDLCKPEDLRLQNATLLRKSAPGPPNSSDEHISCAAPETENASVQILFKCPLPAIAFGNAAQPSRFAHFWQGAQSLAPATRNDISTSKSGANMWCFSQFDFEMCLAPKRRALFRHLNFQKWSQNGVLCTFWLRNVLRATMACTCSTSQLPKVVRTWSFFFAFSRANVLRATTVCTFSTSQLPKVLRMWGVFSFFTCKCASRHNGVHFFDVSTSRAGVLCTFWLRNVLRATTVFFISHLARWLRTRRFSEPTFRPSGATNHWKNTVFRDFPTFSRTCIFFLLTLSLLWSSLFYSSLLSGSSHLCFHVSMLLEVWLLNFLRSSWVRFFGHRFRHVGFWYPFWVWISRVISSNTVFGSAEGFHFSGIRTLNNPAWDAMGGSHGLEWFECHRATICSMSTVHVRMRMRQNAFWEMPLDMKAMLACMPRVCDVWWTGEGKCMVFTSVNLHFIVATVSILIHIRVQVVHVVSKMNLRRLSKRAHGVSLSWQNGGWRERGNPREPKGLIWNGNNVQFMHCS